MASVLFNEFLLCFHSSLPPGDFTPQSTAPQKGKALVRPWCCLFTKVLWNLHLMTVISNQREEILSFSPLPLENKIMWDVKSNKRCCYNKKTREEEMIFKIWAGRRIDFCTWFQYKVFYVTFNNSLTMALFPFCIKYGLHFLTSLSVRIEVLSQNEFCTLWALFKTDTCPKQSSVETGQFRENLICVFRTWYPPAKYASPI